MTLPEFNTDTWGLLVYNNNHLVFLRRDSMNEYKVTVRNGSTLILSEIIKAEDEREVLGTLLISSELFNQPFTDIRILER
jgi:hypothetical protein